jgi:catechol 2,3-dioxygenase-like lactoylglutathione lyase family enzyme
MEWLGFINFPYQLKYDDMLAYQQAFSGYSVDDIPKARSFYKEILGLRVSDNEMGLLQVFTDGNSPLVLYPKPNHEPATFTVLNFMVPDIKQAVHQLNEEGVVFEQYEAPIQTDEDGICWSSKGPNIAWFKDPAGNILSLIEVDSHK